MNDARGLCLVGALLRSLFSKKIDSYKQKYEISKNIILLWLWIDFSKSWSLSNNSDCSPDVVVHRYHLVTDRISREVWKKVKRVHDGSKTDSGRKTDVSASSHENKYLVFESKFSRKPFLSKMKRKRASRKTITSPNHVISDLYIDQVLHCQT